MRRHTNGRRNPTPIEQAMALLLHNQAAFVAQQVETNKALVETKKALVDAERVRANAELEFRQSRANAELEFRRSQANAELEFKQSRTKAELEFKQFRAESELRFARIEKDLEEIKAVLLRHERILANLPDVISRKIGFKAK